MDIRLLIAGLRPMADFRSHTERTIDVLHTTRNDAIADDNTLMVEELDDLVEFWSRLLANLNEAEGRTTPDFEPSPDPGWMND